jgi:hypothetical protein
MDLHARITQQVDRAETAIRAQLQGRRVAFKPDDGGPIITGAVTDVAQTSDGPQFTITQYDVEPVDEGLTDLQAATAALRRCEADRRILARHALDPAQADSWMFATACMGCGTEGDFQEPVTENLGDCPELLDLAHAHGITDEILAGLDQPQPPERPKRKPHPEGFAGMLRDAFTAALNPPITTSDVPEALRGPRWKP